ncbi:MAG: hypothetical protein ABII07_02310 [Patescibacteria group bacterium]|nr:hypothetical protein [Patescibacteria group bacterium]
MHPCDREGDPIYKIDGLESVIQEIMTDPELLEAVKAMFFFDFREMGGPKLGEAVLDRELQEQAEKAKEYYARMFAMAVVDSLGGPWDDLDKQTRRASYANLYNQLLQCFVANINR